MKNFIYAVICGLALTGLTGCPGTTPAPTPAPTPTPPTDTSNCSKACDHMAELKCPEGQPLSDGTSCAKWCEDTQNSGHALNPTCAISIATCADLANCQPSNAQ